jgi:cell division protease FtsH
MSEALGNVAYDRERSPYLQTGIPMPQSRDYSEATAQAVDAAVRSLVNRALERASRILEHNRALLDRTAEELLKTETLNQSQLETLKRDITLPPEPAMPATPATP